MVDIKLIIVEPSVSAPFQTIGTLRNQSVSYTP